MTTRTATEEFEKLASTKMLSYSGGSGYRVLVRNPVSLTRKELRRLTEKVRKTRYPLPCDAVRDSDNTKQRKQSNQ